MSSYQKLIAGLAAVLPGDRIIQDPLQRVAYGTDASFYRLVPQVVLRIESEREASAVIRACDESKLAYTFRAAGTSLSGQALSDSVLIQLSRLWNGISVENDGQVARFQPAVLGSSANSALAKFGRRIGPDPASLDSAMIAGIAANNSSGMCCGNTQDLYHTLLSMRVVFRDGSVLDSASEASRREFANRHPEILRRLEEISQRTKRDEMLSARIRQKYRIKNTVGYCLNALVDFEDPFDILTHLMIGSEGTLGFMSEISCRTIAVPKFQATALVFFDDMLAACESCAAIEGKGVAAAELMDRASLRSVENKPGVPADIRALSPAAAALLLEVNGDSEEALEASILRVSEALAPFTVRKPRFTATRQESNQLWLIRKGLFPSLGYSRAPGTTIIIEDVAVSLDLLGAASTDLRDLLNEHHYADAAIFGHALQGNMHFVFCPDFNRPAEVAAYERFMEDLTDLIAGRYDGSIKAEHGTGRNMAPFVEREWGPAAFGLMREIKEIFDPEYLANPGVILNPDPRSHVKDLKKTPAVHPIIEKCTECGFCERTCPSRNLTLTPRQRIAGWREIARMQETGENPSQVAAMRESFGYMAEETCAVDGLCAGLCPVGIDTGQFIKACREERHSENESRTAGLIARNMGVAVAAIRVALGAARLAKNLLGEHTFSAITRSLSGLSGRRIPEWNRWVPGPAQQVKAVSPASVDVIYFPSCVSRIFGPSDTAPSQETQSSVFLRLLKKAGFTPGVPEAVNSLCCGMAFSSKGYSREAASKRDELIEALRIVSKNAELPIVFDTSPCACRMREEAGGEPSLRVYDPAEFLLDQVAPRLNLHKLERTVALHVPCSIRKMALETKMLELAGRCATHVWVPSVNDVPCCGFAGDRGFTHPELTASALISLKLSMPSACDRGYSTSRTCEIGATRHSGIDYQSLFYLVDEAS